MLCSLRGIGWSSTNPTAISTHNGEFLSLLLVAPIALRAMVKEAVSYRSQHDGIFKLGQRNSGWKKEATGFVAESIRALVRGRTLVRERTGHPCPGMPIPGKGEGRSGRAETRGSSLPRWPVAPCCSLAPTSARPSFVSRPDETSVERCLS